jgi:hypothetical protein
VAKLKKILVCGLNVHARAWIEALLDSGCEVTWAPTDSDLRANPDDLVLLSSPQEVLGLKAIAKSVPLFYRERLVHRYHTVQEPLPSSDRISEQRIERVRALAFVGDVGLRLKSPVFADALIDSLQSLPSAKDMPKCGAFQVLPRHTLRQWMLGRLASKGLTVLKDDQCVLSFSAPRNDQVTAIYNAPFGQESFEAAYWASRTASLRIEGSDRRSSDRVSPFYFASKGAWIEASVASSLPPVVFEIASNEAGSYFVDTGQWMSGAFNRMLVLHHGPKAWIQIDTLCIDGADLPVANHSPFERVFPQLGPVLSQLKSLDLCDERVVDAEPQTKITLVGARLKVLKTCQLEWSPLYQSQMLSQELGL